MKQISSKKELIISLIFGICFISIFYLGFIVSGWIGMILVFFSLIFGVASGLTFLLLIINSIWFKNYTKNRIVNICIVGLSIFVVTFQPIEMIIEKVKSPAIFIGICEHTVTSLWIVLREDKTFEYNAGAFLEREIYYGKYEILDSLVMLSFDDIKNKTTSDTLVITNNGLSELSTNTKHHHIFIGDNNKLIK